MPDKIVNNFDWSREPANKGKSKYSHLMDGQTRVLDMRDYGHTEIQNFRVVLNATARNMGLQGQSKTLDKFRLAFRVTERER